MISIMSAVMIAASALTIGQKKGLDANLLTFSDIILVPYSKIIYFFLNHGKPGLREFGFQLAQLNLFLLT